MRAALLLLLLGAAPQWAYVPPHLLLERAKIVVGGEVVSLGKDAAGKPFALLKVDLVLKGTPEAPEIKLPFKLDINWGCDFTITYEKGKKYLLLLDDRAPFRVLYYPVNTHEEISDYQAHQVQFARLALDMIQGVNLEKNLTLVLQKCGPNGAGKREFVPLLRTVPRTVARAHLEEIRAAHGPAYWPPGKPKPGDWDNFRRYGLAEELEVTRDLALVAELLKADFDDEAPVLRTLGLLTGSPVKDLAAFRKSWAMSVWRAERWSDSKPVPRLVKVLGAADAADRDEASTAILDLGPSVLGALKDQPASPDLEVRARVVALVRELELLSDLGSDLAARRN